MFGAADRHAVFSQIARIAVLVLAAGHPLLLAPALLLAAVVGSFQVIFEREDYSV